MKKKPSNNRQNRPEYPNPDVEKPKEALGDSDFEEKLLLFWRNHGNRVVVALVVLAAGVLAYQLSGFIAKRSQEKVQAAYQKAENTADLIAFGAEHSRNSLGGFAYLQAAHEEYGRNQFKEAAAHYEAAAQILTDSPFAGRARLGFAMASLQGDEPVIGRQTLESITADEALLDSTRAEAAYNLAVFHWDREKFDEVEKQLDFIETLAKPGFWIWTNKADQLRDLIPELRQEPEPETETAGL